MCFGKSQLDDFGKFPVVSHFLTEARPEDVLNYSQTRRLYPAVRDRTEDISLEPESSSLSFCGSDSDFDNEISGLHFKPNYHHLQLIYLPEISFFRSGSFHA